jgi:hypothetical protein
MTTMRGLYHPMIADHVRSSAVEVSEAYGPLVDLLVRLGVRVVSIEGRFLGPTALRRERYVCASLPRGGTVTFLLSLIEQALGNQGLRDALTDVGHPKVAEVGDRCLIWWPELRGQVRTIH